jgi:hypothetical protein
VGDRRGAYRVLVGKLRERDLLEDLDRWEVNIKMDFHFKEVGGEAWIGLIWLRIGTDFQTHLNVVMNLRVP